MAKKPSNSPQLGPRATPVKELHFMLWRVSRRRRLPMKKLQSWSRLIKPSRVSQKVRLKRVLFPDEIARCASQLTGPGGSQPLGGGGANPLGQNPAEIFRRLSTDPRTKDYMSDPSYVQMLQDLSKDPGNAMKHMADPRMQATLQGKIYCSIILLFTIFSSFWSQHRNWCWG